MYKSVSNVLGESNTSGSGTGTWSSEGPSGHMASSDAPRTTWCKVVSLHNHRNSCMRNSTASLPNLTRTSRLNQSSAAAEHCAKKLG